jgi:hypothetical protein
MVCKTLKNANNTFSCVVCEKSLQNLFFAKVGENIPHGAVGFVATGDFGSRVFDCWTGSPAEAQELIINICDECLKRASEKHLVAARYNNKRKIRKWITH